MFMSIFFAFFRVSDVCGLSMQYTFFPTARPSGPWTYVQTQVFTAFTASRHASRIPSVNYARGEDQLS